MVNPELEGRQGERQVSSTSSQQGKLRHQEGVLLGFSSWAFLKRSYYLQLCPMANAIPALQRCYSLM